MNELRIGERIRELRVGRGLTQADVATRTGFSPALISQIENNRISPPLSTLYKIAKYFGVRLSFFFEEEGTPKPFEVIRASTESAAEETVRSHGYRARALLRTLSHRKMEPRILEVASSIDFTAAEEGHGGEEFILVLSGKVEVEIEEQRFTLESGDALYLDGSLRHRLIGCGGDATRVLSLVCR
ncbi:MAG: helix-turn-helix domain-containing protein [Vicinamibacteria bacterium]